MAYCANCGKQLSDAAPMCPECGHPRTAAGGVRALQRTEGTAIASLVCGIAGFVVCPLVLHIAAIVLGNQARTKLRADPTLEGESMARAGIILGWVGIGLTVLVGVAVLLAFALSAGSSSSSFRFS